MKGKKISKALISLALTAMLCFSSIVSVFAAPVVTPPELTGDAVISGDPDSPAQAGITKILQKAEGVETPDIDFEFEAVAKSFNGDTAQASSVPAIPTDKLSVSYDAASTGTVTDGVEQIILETGDLLEAGADGIEWTQEGVYEYTISEKPTTDPDTTDLTVFSDSQAIYQLVVYVREDPDQSGTFYVYAVSAYPSTVDNDDQEVNTKLDPTPGGNGVNTTYSEIAFTNNYIKNNGTPSDDVDDIINDGVLTISEAIIPSTGTFDTTVEFDYTVTLTKSPLVRDNLENLEYHAYVISADGTAVVGSMITIPMTDPDGDGDYTGTVTQVLTDGQRLVFVDLPVGTSYEATVAPETDYGASVKVTVDTTQTTIGGTVVGDGVSTGTKVISDKTNLAEFEHELEEVTPTGISLTSMPFVIMMLLIIAAVLVFLVVRSRSRKRA